MLNCIILLLFTNNNSLKINNLQEIN